MQETRIRRGLGSALAAAVVAIALPLGGSITTEASTVSGGGVLNATVTLSQFPCPSPSACAATTSGAFRGEITGLDLNGRPYTLTFPDPAAIHSVPPPNFTSSGLTFTDLCEPPTTAPAIADTGTGDGSFQVAGGLLTQGTLVSHGAVLKGGAHFTRDGLNMALGLSGVSVVDASSNEVADGSLAAGDVAFVLPAADLTASCDKINFSPSNATIGGAVVSGE